MRTRTRYNPQREETYDESSDLDFDLEMISDEDIDEFLEKDDSDKEEGFWNLQVIAGLTMIAAGGGYLAQLLGFAWTSINLSLLLPPLFALSVLLIGFGLINKRSKKRKKEKKIEKKYEKRRRKNVDVRIEEINVEEEFKKLQKSRDKKISGVSAGIAEYFGIDPTLVRLLFVVGAIVGSGASIPLYIILSFVLGDPPRKNPQERITIIREKV